MGDGCSKRKKTGGNNVIVTNASISQSRCWSDQHQKKFASFREKNEPACGRQARNLFKLLF